MRAKKRVVGIASTAAATTAATTIPVMGIRHNKHAGGLYHRRWRAVAIEPVQAGRNSTLKPTAQMYSNEISHFKAREPRSWRNMAQRQHKPHRKTTATAAAAAAILAEVSPRTAVADQELHAPSWYWTQLGWDTSVPDWLDRLAARSGGVVAAGVTSFLHNNWDGCQPTPVRDMSHPVVLLALALNTVFEEAFQAVDRGNAYDAENATQDLYKVLTLLVQCAPVSFASSARWGAIYNDARFTFDDNLLLVVLQLDAACVLTLIASSGADLTRIWIKDADWPMSSSLGRMIETSWEPAQHRLVTVALAKTTPRKCIQLLLAAEATASPPGAPPLVDEVLSLVSGNEKTPARLRFLLEDVGLHVGPTQLATAEAAGWAAVGGNQEAAQSHELLRHAHAWDVTYVQRQAWLRALWAVHSGTALAWTPAWIEGLPSACPKGGADREATKRARRVPQPAQESTWLVCVLVNCVQMNIWDAEHVGNDAFSHACVSEYAAMVASFL